MAVLEGSMRSELCKGTQTTTNLARGATGVGRLWQEKTTKRGGEQRKRQRQQRLQVGCSLLSPHFVFLYNREEAERIELPQERVTLMIT
mmetsp:Transcript_31067/g.65933  ORF Transcript_31067/g.65933 Transcript_31067/m.65933 type:complete len:89 (+) Transcript_31067:71-337(+)